MSLLISVKEFGLPVPNAALDNDDLYMDVHTISGVSVYERTVTVTYNDGKPDLVVLCDNLPQAAWMARKFATAKNYSQVPWDGFIVG